MFELKSITESCSYVEIGSKLKEWDFKFQNLEHNLKTFKNVLGELYPLQYFCKFMILYLINRPLDIECRISKSNFKDKILLINHKVIKDYNVFYNIQKH